MKGICDLRAGWAMMGRFHFKMISIGVIKHNRDCFVDSIEDEFAQQRNTIAMQ